MLQPLRSRPGRGPAVIGRSLPAPIGGWNARDALGDMDPRDAVTLDNWFPSTSSVLLRNGFSSYATGLGTGAVESLIIWGGATQKMLAAANNKIYDVSSSGAVGAELVGTLTNNRWQWSSMGTAGGQFVVMVNGADTPLKFDGTTLATTSITAVGLTSSNLVNVTTHKQRLFFCEVGTLKFWYLPVSSISGTAVAFDLSSLCRRGGYLMSIGTWTRDGGSGPDDLIAFITSMGEVLVYSGTDPGDATAWSLEGVFEMGAPVGRRCMVKVGGDLVIITQDGFVPMAQVLPVARSNNAAAISNKIGNVVSQSLAVYGSHFGWQPLLYPRGNMVIFNVPISENGTIYQYVMNTITRAWCRFTGMNACCWGLYNDLIYFGGTDGTVYLADSGNSDNGSNIEGDVKQAFNYFGSPGQLKRFTLVRPLLTTDGNISPAIDLNLDFEDKLPSTTPTFSGTGGSAWDTSDWDTSEWGDSGQILKDWQSVSGLGYCAALRMKVASNSLEVSWQSTDFLFEPGGYV